MEAEERNRKESEKNRSMLGKLNDSLKAENQSLRNDLNASL